MTYRIRRVSAADVLPLTDELLPGDKTWHATAVYWGAFLGDEMIAYAGLVIPDKTCKYYHDAANHYTDVVYLNSAGVLPAHRGHGLQRRLIRTRLNWARRNGYKWAVSDTVPSNPKSARNLIRCGFLPFWPSEDWRWRISGACYWIKGLLCARP